MKITLELTEDEAIYVCQNCIQRVVNSALAALPEDYDFIQDVEELGQFMEPIRNKLCNAIFIAKTEK